MPQRVMAFRRLTSIGPNRARIAPRISPADTPSQRQTITSSGSFSRESTGSENAARESALKTP